MTNRTWRRAAPYRGHIVPAEGGLSLIFPPPAVVLPALVINGEMMVEIREFIHPQKAFDPAVTSMPSKLDRYSRMERRQTSTPR
jgi:hypothetical protein